MRRLLKPVAETVRVFTGSKVIHNRAMNSAGIQVARALAARAVHQTSRYDPEAARDAVATLHRDGCVTVPSLLDAEHLERAREEAYAALAREAEHRRVHDHGGALVEHLDLRQLPRDRYPALRAIVEHPTLVSLLSGAERRPVEPWSCLAAVERVTQQPTEHHDAESDLHTDIFFDTHKAWFFLTDVELDDGPFVYVPGSHKLNLDRLRRIYVESVTTNRGSRRIDADELAACGGREQAFTVPANTLVSANVSGFHRRMRGKEGRQRVGLIFSARSNPFFPHWMDADRWLTRRNPVVRWFAKAAS